jgi:hypothetical protein
MNPGREKKKIANSNVSFRHDLEISTNSHPIFSFCYFDVSLTPILEKQRQ